MSDDFDDVVVPFPRGQFERAHNQREAAYDELAVRTTHSRACAHESSTVDAEARTVSCRSCKVSLDPIDVLVSLARRREQLVAHGQRLRQEVDWLERLVDDLKRQERNAKARIRKARQRRNDRAALVAGAEAAGGVGGYRPWGSLNEPQQEAVLERIRSIVEAYAGELARAEDEMELAGARARSDDNRAAYGRGVDMGGAS